MDSAEQIASSNCCRILSDLSSACTKYRNLSSRLEEYDICSSLFSTPPSLIPPTGDADVHCGCVGARASLAEEVTFFADVLRPSEAVVGDDTVLMASAVDHPYTRTQAGVMVML